MSDTTFVDGTTVVNAAWLNDVNRKTYDDMLNVKSYGAVGDGVTDDTAAFLAASADGDTIYVPHTANSYLVSDLNLPLGTRIIGGGTIKTGAGTLINLNTVSLEPDNGPMRVMFIESDKQGWEEFLDIKSCGYNTIMAYQWYTNLVDIIANAEAVGLKIIVHSLFTSSNTASWSTLATAQALYDSRPSVIGYYVLDEPASTAISVANQDIAINYFRALTNKPLSCAESQVTFSITGSLSSNYDTIFIDVYYADSYTTGNDAIAAYIKDFTNYSFTAPQAKLIPLLGLFNGTGFAKTTSEVTSLAEQLIKFSEDGAFSVFVWNAGLVDGYAGVRNTTVYRQAAKDLVAIASSMKPWKIEVVPIGTLFASSNKLGEVWYNTVDSATPGLVGTSSIVPYATINTGIATSFREYTFADNGLMVKGTTARCGFSGMPSGICCAYLRWDNRDNADSISVVLGSSSDLGYTVESSVTQVIVNATAESFYKQLDNGGSFGNMPIMEVTIAASVSFPFCYLKGYLTFTDVPEVSF